MKKLKKLKTLSVQGGGCPSSQPVHTRYTYQRLSGYNCSGCGTNDIYCFSCDQHCDQPGGGGGGVPYFEQN